MIKRIYIMFVCQKQAWRYMKYKLLSFSEKMNELYFFLLFFEIFTMTGKKLKLFFFFWRSNHLETSVFTIMHAMACGSQQVHTFISTVNSLSVFGCVGKWVVLQQQETKKQTDSNSISGNFLCGLGQTFCNCKEPYGYLYSIAMKCG